MDVNGEGHVRSTTEAASPLEDLAQRMVRLAQSAAACHRASILDLLSDDTEVGTGTAGEETVGDDLIGLQAPARLAAPWAGEREVGSVHGCDVRVVPARRCTEAAQ